MAFGPALAADVTAAQGNQGQGDAAKWMDPTDLLKLDCNERMAWARQRIGAHVDDLLRSARNNEIPPELLAVIILNELADYDPLDIGQENIPSTGSVGIAQINVNTALSHDLLDGFISEREVREVADWRVIPLRGDSDDTPADRARKYVAWRLLNDNEVAIEAAAREIDRILKEMSDNPDGPWARFFVKGRLDRDNIYENVKPSHIAAPRAVSGARLSALERSMDPTQLQRRRESALAIGVAAAYNTPNILASDYDHTYVWEMPGEGNPFTNARRHGLQADQVWIDCFQNPAADGFFPEEEDMCTTWTVQSTLTVPSSRPGGQPSTHRVEGLWRYNPQTGEFRAMLGDVEVRNWSYTFSIPRQSLRPGGSFNFTSIEGEGTFRDSLGSYQGQVTGPGRMSGTFTYKGGSCCGSQEVLGRWEAVCADRR